MAKTKKNKKTEYVYHEGDNLYKISKELTGNDYMIYRLLERSGIDINTLKEGDVIKWKK